MARAWLELADEEETIDSGDGTSVLVRRTVTQQLDRPVALPVPEDWVATALVAPRRSRVPYYLALLLNLLFFLTGAALLAVDAFNGVESSQEGAAGFIIVAASAVAGFAIGDWRPKVCTCPKHNDMYGCPSR